MTVALESEGVLSSLLNELAEVFLKAEQFEDAIAAADYANGALETAVERQQEFEQAYAEACEVAYERGQEKQELEREYEAVRTQLRAALDKLNRQEEYFGQKFFNPSNLNETGPKRPNRPKLTEAEVGGIRSMVGNGSTIRSVAKVYGVHPSTVSRIASGVYHKGEDQA